MIGPMFKHFHELLESYNATVGTRLGTGPIDRITSNYTNIQNILQNGLRREHPNIVDVAYCACHFNDFSRHIAHGATFLLEDINNTLSSSEDHWLKAYLITELNRSSHLHPIPHPELLIVEALNHFKYFDDPDLEALQHGQIALSLAQTNRNIKRQYDALDVLGYIEIVAGNRTAGRAHAREGQRLATISGDVHREVHGLYHEAISLMALGDYRECLALTLRGRTVLSQCGLSHGQLNYGLLGIQAELHKLKSEYAEAHDMQTQILQGTADDNYQQGFALMSIAEINILTGVPKLPIQKND
ncbi:hypothetical protein B0H16DRAFT_1768963 [Mycena metata]|uniref:MalT-like TPR region domain-containing protein n=1 Tax=Mycena metata TaxID=1033252 RepID=A0AAD7NR97_9AGAR|nr:hypothetical protein B0H16DRAFT_1768963 [Mycena metata]